MTKKRKSKEIKNKFAGEKITTSLFPSLVKTKKTRSKPTSPKKNPIDYYNCLLNYAQTGFVDEEGKQKIHSCCKKCKANAPALNNQRDKEVFKLITNYRQVGDSLAKLLKPVK
jgi:hypothetical protein